MLTTCVVQAAMASPGLTDSGEGAHVGVAYKVNRISAVLGFDPSLSLLAALKQVNELLGIHPEDSIMADMLLRTPLNHRATLQSTSQHVLCNHAMCTFNDAITLTVSLRSTWGRCHGTQERVANVPESWEEKRRVDVPLPSCAHAVHSGPTTASTDVDTVVNRSVQCIAARQKKVGKMKELGESMKWRGATRLESIIT